MRMLSDDDLDLSGLSDEELSKAWDLWFDLAQTTNDSDPPFTHGSLAYVEFAPQDGPDTRLPSTGGRRENRHLKDDGADG